MAELADAGRGRLHRRRPARCARRRRDAPGAPVPAARRPRAGAARGGSLAVAGRRDARGRGLDAARPGRHPVDLRSRRRSSATLRSPATRGAASTSSTSPPRESVEAIERGRGRRGSQVTAEVTPHHLLLTDDAVRSLDPHFKMNPPLRSEDDRQALIEGLRSGVARLRRHRPRAALAGGEGGAVRAGADGRHRAGDARSRRSTPSWSCPACSTSRCWSSG